MLYVSITLNQQKRLSLSNKINDFNNTLNKAVSQTLKLLYNARAYIIMRASYDSIDNKQNVCGKINFSYHHSTQHDSTELFKIFFSLLTLQLLFCKKLVGREKMFNFKVGVLIGWLSHSIHDSVNQSAFLKVKHFCFYVQVVYHFRPNSTSYKSAKIDVTVKM